MMLDLCSLNSYLCLVFFLSELITVAIIEVIGNQSFVYINGENSTTVWPGGIPWDGLPIIEINSPLLPLLVICYIYSSLGIFFALFCLIFNIIFRKKK